MKVTAVIATAVLALTLTACGGDADTSSVEKENVTEVGAYGESSVVTYPLKDGREVTCVLYSFDRGGAPDCDWDNAVQADSPNADAGKPMVAGAYGEVRAMTQAMPNGDKVTCVIYNFDRSGGPSCDFQAR